MHASRRPLRRLPRLLLPLLALAGAPVRADTPPQLSGKIEVELSSGLVRGDFCLSQLPAGGAGNFLLNRGLNIRRVYDKQTAQPLAFEGGDDSVGVGDAVRYTIAKGIGAAGYCVSYTGAFPVFRVDAGDWGDDDWKGLVAFDGRSIRAADQTRLFPVAELGIGGAQLEAMRFDVEVDCPACRNLYMNGAAPAAGPRARFRSTTPREPMLYAGDFPVATIDGSHFIGAEANPADAATIAAGIDALAELHQQYLGLPYAERPAFLSFAAVSSKRQLGKKSWAFVTWPTVATDGRLPFSSMLETVAGKRQLLRDDIDFMSHEMAHYYFGTSYHPRGPLTWFLTESTAEFLSLKTTRALRGDGAYQAKLDKLFQRALKHQARFLPLDQVRRAGEIDEDYRYQLGPLLLLALERYAGDEAVRKTLSTLVARAPQTPMDYSAFKAALIEAGAAPAALQRYADECLRPALAQGCLATYRTAGAAPR